MARSESGADSGRLSSQSKFCASFGESRGLGVALAARPREGRKQRLEPFTADVAQTRGFWLQVFDNREEALKWLMLGARNG